jgi:CO/xanthine dehydrogenase FAD-binding subunit
MVEERAVKPAPFDYAAPASVGEAVALLDDPDRDSTVLAGGQSLLPMLSMRLARPDLVVDIGRIPDIAGISERDGALVFGTMATKGAVERSALVRRRQPLLHAATQLVGHPQIRNRGTVGGSMAQADPVAEYPAVAVATDAWMHTVGPRGERTIRASDFFVTYLTTALEQGELLVEVGIPALPEGTGWAFTELSRRHGDFAMAGTAVTVRLDADACFSDVRIVVFGVGPVPTRMATVEEILHGERPDAALYRRAGDAARDAIDDPLADIHAAGEYRRHLAGVLTERGIADAVARATPQTEGS